MAKFEVQLPTEILKDADFLAKNAVKIFEGMTTAGAKEVKGYIEQGAKQVFRPATAAKLNAKLKVTRPYETPSDGGINTKVAFYGYIPRSDGSKVKVKGGYYSGVPAPLLARLREYGASGSGAMPPEFKKYWTKKPFVRPAFQKTAAIEKAMLKAQKELSGGLLE